MIGSLWSFVSIYDTIAAGRVGRASRRVPLMAHSNLVLGIGASSQYSLFPQAKLSFHLLNLCFCPFLGLLLALTVIATTNAVHVNVCTIMTSSHARPGLWELWKLLDSACAFL